MSTKTYEWHHIHTIDRANVPVLCLFLHNRSLSRMSLRLKALGLKQSFLASITHPFHCVFEYFLPSNKLHIATLWTIWHSVPLFFFFFLPPCDCCLARVICSCREGGLQLSELTVTVGVSHRWMVGYAGLKYANRDTGTLAKSARSLNVS